MQTFQKKIDVIMGLGETPSLSLQEKQTIRIINGINFIVVCILVGVFFINIFSHNYSQSLSNILIIFLICLPVFIWNYKKYYQLAKVYFIMGIFAIVVISTLTAYKAEKFTETENIAFLAGIIIVILFEGRLKLVLYLLLTTLLFGLKALKAMLMHNTIGLLYFHTLINTSIVLVGIYSFTTFFRNKLLASNASLQELMRQLKSRNEEINIQNEEIRSQNDQLNIQQKLLDKQKNTLRSLIDAMPLFIALLDKEGKYVIANKSYEYAFKMSIEDIENNHYTKVLTPELVKNHRPLIERGLLGKSSDFEEFTILPNGQALYAHGKYIPILSADGSEVQFLAVFVDDITALKESERKLADSNQIKDKLFSIISHDLREPLNSLLALIDFVQKDFITEQELKIFLMNITKNITSVSQLLENLLQWSRSQMQQQTIQPITFPLNEIVENNFNLFRKQAEQKQIQLLSNNADVLVFADKNTIDLVVRNLLFNALKFSNFDSKIEVIVEVKDKFASVSVKDYGIGIPSEILYKLLREELISTQGTNKEKGTGLGLMLCREFVEKNGGKLSIVSQEGKGSTFSFTIPLAFSDNE